MPQDMLARPSSHAAGDEFQADALVAVETISAVLDAFGRGEIELVVDPKAPHKHVLPSGKTYTLGTVARFLNWVKPSTGEPTAACRNAFDAYRERACTSEALASSIFLDGV